ncbi:MAG: nucleotidyltransferase domain-containing protein [Deltaproteobacteria bacterium]|nr:nucleotidyltransferase domain-containing protein [Deltaproteobacteria bacterium]
MRLLTALQERAKELNCLYVIEDILNRSWDVPLPDVLRRVAEILPSGWQYPEICTAAIRIDKQRYGSVGYRRGEWQLVASIESEGEVLGQVEVHYTEARPQSDIGPFLREEERLLKTIGDRLAHVLLFRRMRAIRETTEHPAIGMADWREPLRLLRRSHRDLYRRSARKMLHHLCRIGIPEAQRLLSQTAELSADETGEVNEPGEKRWMDPSLLLSERPFEIAAEQMTSNEILARVEQWILEDRVGDLIKVIDSRRSSTQEVADAIRRFRQQGVDEEQLPISAKNGLRASLIRRLLSDHPLYMRSAKEVLSLDDFEYLLDRMILPRESRGKLGGKGAGLFLANRILATRDDMRGRWGDLRMPRTWYLATDGLTRFIEHNDLQDVLEQKYRDIAEVRHQYRNVVQMFKHSKLSSEVIHGLSSALDDLGEVPLVVRSSSLLEDSYGTSFSGKYKSLFLANQGTKRERLAALADAIAEIYASTFSPDAIAYRAERDLTDYHEEMGVLIQEVVGKRVGEFFFPSFAGVAFSHNEFRWSPRISRKDGLIRLVPGLGTRAVDRLGDDYPVLLVPAKPKLRANASVDEVVRYAPRKLDAINLDARHFETVDIDEFLRKYGDEFEALDRVFSIYEAPDTLRQPSRMLCDPRKDRLVVTFEGLVSKTPFVERIHGIMQALQDALQTPVDIEFASDGDKLYLLQCRPQSNVEECAPAPIPSDVDESRIIFSANRHVSNGNLPNITHIVYVDPERYGALATREQMLRVGQAVGALNKMLPKRQFVLMGPGRWGSRGDVKLGVSVTYADISNTAMLVEIARKKGNYVPDLSFGTHFFQDLVESRIRYLPLYPDEEGVDFNERFLRSATNLLPELSAEFADVSEVLRVIDVPAAANGRILRVLLNADLDKALALLTNPEEESLERTDQSITPALQPVDDRHWRWRLRYAESVSRHISREDFGVKGVFVFGSTKNATSQAGSDIDLLIHLNSTETQQKALEQWLQGFSHCLSDVNYMRTGYRVDQMLDVHYVTDEDIAQRTSFAVKIGAVTDAARKLPSRPVK